MTTHWKWKQNIQTRADDEHRWGRSCSTNHLQPPGNLVAIAFYCRHFGAFNHHFMPSNSNVANREKNYLFNFSWGAFCLIFRLMVIYSVHHRPLYPSYYDTSQIIEPVIIVHLLAFDIINCMISCGFISVITSNCFRKLVEQSQWKIDTAFHWNSYKQKKSAVWYGCEYVVITYNLYVLYMYMYCTLNNR